MVSQLIKESTQRKPQSLYGRPSIHLADIVSKTLARNVVCILRVQFLSLSFPSLKQRREREPRKIIRDVPRRRRNVEVCARVSQK